MPVTTTEPKFNCGACGKEYRWKPELAGKKAKCKCGGVIAVPAAAPAQPAAASAKPATKPAARPAPKPAAEQDVDFDGLYALAQEETKATSRPQAADESASGYRCPSCSAGIPPGTAVCPNCRLDMRTGTRMAAPAGVGLSAGAGVGMLAAAGAYAGATPTARAAVLPYGGGRATGGHVDEEVLYEGGKFRSLYLPIGLIVLGILFYFGQLAFSNDKLSTGVMIGLVGARVVMDSILIFISMLIAVRGFDMGFGAFGPGILKILAVALGPGALGQMVEEMMGGELGAMIVGGFLTIFLYFTLIKVLFNLDLGETFLLVFLIYGVRRVLGTFLFVAVIGMTSSGLLSEESAGAVGGGAQAVVTAGEDDDVPPKQMLEPEAIAYDLDRGNQMALNALEGSADRPRPLLENHPKITFCNMTHAESLAFLESLEKAGATNIQVLHLDYVKQTDGSPPVARIALIVLELPTDPAGRKKLFDIRAALEKKLKLEPEMVLVEVGGRDEENNKQEPLKDWGQKLLDIRLRGSGYDSEEAGEEGDGDDEMEEGAPDAEAPPAEAPAGARAAETPAAEAPAPDAASPEAAPAEPAPVDAPF